MYTYIKLSIFSELRTESILDIFCTCFLIWFCWIYCTFCCWFIFCKFLVFYRFVFFWKIIKTYNFRFFYLRRSVPLFKFRLILILFLSLFSNFDERISLFSHSSLHIIFSSMISVISIAEKILIIFFYIFGIAHKFRLPEFLCGVCTLL